MTPNPSQMMTLDLRDIHAPAEPAFWPPAPGWWLLGGLILALLILAWVIGRKTWHRRRRRRSVLRELRALSRLGSGPDLAAGVSVLLKRVALSGFDRREVAGLSGDAWLDFLDRTGGNGRFTHSHGRILAVGPYVVTADFDVQGLVELATDWVRKNT